MQLFSVQSNWRLSLYTFITLGEAEGDPNVESVKSSCIKDKTDWFEVVGGDCVLRNIQNFPVQKAATASCDPVRTSLNQWKIQLDYSGK